MHPLFWIANVVLAVSICAEILVWIVERDHSYSAQTSKFTFFCAGILLSGFLFFLAGCPEYRRTVQEIPKSKVSIAKTNTTLYMEYNNHKYETTDAESYNAVDKVDKLYHTIFYNTYGYPIDETLTTEKK